jgi:ATP-dependent RNA helicase DDX47/RRP3
LKKGKVQLERSSFTEETPRQPKPSKKTMDRIDDTKEPAEDLDKKAVKKTATDDVKKAKKEKKRKAESEEPAGKPTPADSPEVDLDTAAPKTFRGLGVIDLICESLAAMGFGLPTPVQLESIPLAIDGRDIIGLVQERLWLS